MKFYLLTVCVVLSMFLTSCKAPNVKEAILKADVHGKAGEWDEAWSLLDRCMDQAELEPQVKPQLYFYAALALQRKSEPDLALAAEYITKALAEDTEKQHVRFLAAHIYYENKDFDLAIETLNPLIDANEKTFRELYKTYRKNQLAGKSTKAEKEALDKLVNEDEDHLALYIRCEYEKYAGDVQNFAKQNQGVDKLYDRQKFSGRIDKEVHTFKALEYLYNNRDRINTQKQLSFAYYRDRKNPKTALNVAVFWDKIAKRRSRAIPAYEKYLKIVEGLPAENTEAVKVQARLRALKPS